MNGPVKVRKRPVVVDAYRYDGTNSIDIAHWVGDMAFISADGELIIRTLEGDHRADAGDYVMRGVAGEYYPIKPAIFDATYDEVNS